MDALFPGRPEDYSGIGQWPELEPMTDSFAEFEKRGDGYDWRAAWFAVIDQATGARLTSEWLEQAHPYVNSPHGRRHTVTRTRAVGSGNDHE
ncbi:hypothetical protein [Sphaerisporangium album]|nr:hypothetical protein [Sphaerisporangium album]